MTSLLVLSHGRKVAAAVEELVRELCPNASVFSVGGAKDGSAGADYDGMKEKLNEALTLGDVIILYDLGSTLMTIQAVMDELTESELNKAHLLNAALVEGAIAASVCFNAEMDAEDIILELRALSVDKA
ncbi:MAG: hypothetical protein FWG94_06710 [Oscillospiraceae bacterium]|nr:hypothetical protein [Oscillospiraceae bacterium]